MPEPTNSTLVTIAPAPTHGVCPTCHTVAPVIAQGKKTLLRSHSPGGIRCSGQDPARTFNALALLAEADRLKTDHAAAVKAILDAEVQLSCEDSGAAWEALGDFHRAHGWTDPENPCQPCTDLYGGAL